MSSEREPRTVTPARFNVVAAAEGRNPWTETQPLPVTPLDLLWIAMWDDLRHNATGGPSGLAIIARYRPQIEAASLRKPEQSSAPEEE